MTSPGCARSWPARAGKPSWPGGQIITALGTDMPNVVGLVYIAGFGLDEGESIAAPCWPMNRQVPPWRISTSTSTASPGFPRTTSSTTSRPVKAKVMFAVQQPLHSLPRGGDGRPGLEVAAVLVPDRRRDQAIPPDAQRQFAHRMGATTVEVSTNHVAMVSHPLGHVLNDWDGRNRSVAPTWRRVTTYHGDLGKEDDMSGTTTDQHDLSVVGGEEG